MRTLGRRPVTDPAGLATGAAECLPRLEAGLRLLDRDASAGEVTLDVAAVDDADKGAAVSLDRVDAREQDVARASSTVRAFGDVEAQHAAALIERLERLRFSEVVR